MKNRRKYFLELFLLLKIFDVARSTVSSDGQHTVPSLYPLKPQSVTYNERYSLSSPFGIGETPRFENLEIYVTIPVSSPVFNNSSLGRMKNIFSNDQGCVAEITKHYQTPLSKISENLQNERRNRRTVRRWMPVFADSADVPIGMRNIQGLTSRSRVSAFMPANRLDVNTKHSVSPFYSRDRITVTQKGGIAEESWSGRFQAPRNSHVRQDRISIGRRNRHFRSFTKFISNSDFDDHQKRSLGTDKSRLRFQLRMNNGRNRNAASGALRHTATCVRNSWFERGPPRKLNARTQRTSDTEEQKSFSRLNRERRNEVLRDGNRDFLPRKELTRMSNVESSFVVARTQFRARNSEGRRVRDSQKETAARSQRVDKLKRLERMPVVIEKSVEDRRFTRSRSFLISGNGNKEQRFGVGQRTKSWRQRRLSSSVEGSPRELTSPSSRRNGRLISDVQESREETALSRDQNRTLRNNKRMLTRNNLHTLPKSETNARRIGSSSRRFLTVDRINVRDILKVGNKRSQSFQKKTTSNVTSRRQAHDVPESSKNGMTNTNVQVVQRRDGEIGKSRKERSRSLITGRYFRSYFRRENGEERISTSAVFSADSRQGKRWKWPTHKFFRMGESHRYSENQHSNADIDKRSNTSNWKYRDISSHVWELVITVFVLLRVSDETRRKKHQPWNFVERVFGIIV